MLSELKPCPFCGSTNIGVRYEGQPAQRYAYQCCDCGGSPKAVWVGGTASGSQILFNNPDAVRLWNARAIEQAAIAEQTVPAGEAVETGGLDIIRRIADRGLKFAQENSHSFIDLFQHVIDEIERVPTTQQPAERKRCAELENTPVTYVQIDGKGPMYAVYGTSSISCVEALQAKVAELTAERDEGLVCGDCDGSGWLHNRVEGRYPCTCMTEAEPYQLLELQVATLTSERGEEMEARKIADRTINEYHEIVQSHKARVARAEVVIEKCIRGLKYRPESTSTIEWFFNGDPRDKALAAISDYQKGVKS